jgi:hypothetical protein
MTPIKQPCSPACRSWLNLAPKPSLLEPRGKPGPNLPKSHPNHFRRLPINHLMSYIYTKILVNYCKHYTYIDASINYCKQTTYYKDCAICVLTQSKGATLPNPLPPLLGFASTFACIAPGGPPAHPNPRFPTPSRLAKTTRRTSTLVPAQNHQLHPKGAEPHLVKPLALLELR